MPWLPFYATESDLLQILEHFKASAEIAFIVSRGPGQWVAVKSLDSLAQGRYCLWHVPSGSLPPFQGSNQEPGEIADPFAGWFEARAGADPSTPYFGAGHSGVFWLNVRAGGGAGESRRIGRHARFGVDRLPRMHDSRFPA